MPIGVCVMHSTRLCGENKRQIKTKSKTNEELINNVMALIRATLVFRNWATIFVFNVLFAILINFFHRSLVHSYLSPLWCFSILQTNIFCSLLVDGGFERRQKNPTYWYCDSASLTMLVVPVQLTQNFCHRVFFPCFFYLSYRMVVDPAVVVFLSCISYQ